MEPQKVIISHCLEQTLTEAIGLCSYDKLFVLCDDITEKVCLPVVSGFGCMKDALPIVIAHSDSSKTIESVMHVWSQLQTLGATRHSLMVNIGGGMVTDLGGFAASTFKRGISFINIPTTLLAMIDASVGGKTGFNFGGLKNEIGVFSNADSVILDTVFLKTLDHQNLLSGYAEMLKHGLISNEKMWAELINTGVEDISLQMIADSVAVKQRIVTEDPLEHGLRKALNLGHTVGHAFEAMSLERTQHPSPNTQHPAPILHGYAVAWGLVCELYLSAIKTGFPTDKMHQTVAFVKERYGKMAITCNDYPTLLQLMTHDKKNTAGTINFTLLGGIGNIIINQNCTDEEICEALDFYREC